MKKTSVVNCLLGLSFACLFLGDAAWAQEVSSTETASDSAGMPWYGYLIPLLGIVGLGFTFWKSKWVSSQEAGNETMERIAQNITEGAMSFLKA